MTCHFAATVRFPHVLSEQWVKPLWQHVKTPGQDRSFRLAGVQAVKVSGGNLVESTFNLQSGTRLKLLATTEACNADAIRTTGSDGIIAILDITEKAKIKCA